MVQRSPKKSKILRQLDGSKSHSGKFYQEATSHKDSLERKSNAKKRIHLNVRDNEIHKLIEVYIHKRTVSMQVKFEEYKLKK